MPLHPPTGCPAVLEDMYFVYNRKVMSLHEQLNAYGVGRDSNLSLVTRFCGGGPKLDKTNKVAAPEVHELKYIYML